MNKVVRIKDLTIGEGIPKICVPIIGKTKKEIMDEAKDILKSKFHLIEWRVDFFEKVREVHKVIIALKELRTIIGDDNILLFTFRTKGEGGEIDLPYEYYLELYKEVIKSKVIDIIDIELFIGDSIVKELVESSHKHNIKVVMSNHDFYKTPDEKEIISRLCKMQELGADIPKIAVMPESPRDVLTLLEATNEMKEVYGDRPFITMSMKGTGIISRISGEVFGSSITFGAIKKASAPGQISSEDLYKIISVIHENL